MSLLKDLKIMDDETDKEGNIKNEEKYHKAKDDIQEELSIMSRYEIEEELEELKKLIKKHHHLEGKVVREV